MRESSNFLIIRRVNQYTRPSYGLLILTAFIGFFSHLQALDPEVDPFYHAKGAIPLTEEQIQEIQSTWPQILGVNPNKYGADRIKTYMLELGFSPLEAETIGYATEEFLTNQNTDPVALAEHKDRIARLALPSSVDNSKLPCFPPIGDQGQIGSCVAWATIYYHATHEYGLLNGLNNRAVGAAGIRSPKWVYNIINFGEDQGAYPPHGYMILDRNGAVAYNDFPYDRNFLEWDLNPQHWISAMSYRMNPAQFIPIATPQDIDIIKQILNNGHIVSFVTFANSWQFTKVGVDPTQTSNPYAGENAISWMQGTAGSHHVTIVGYDDNMWVDVNGNGQVDAGEKGAFLMANSWGTSWGNKGFMWISYDAFYKNSAVVNGPSNNRYPIAVMSFSTTPKRANYTPKVIAKFTLSQASREQLDVRSGFSTADGVNPSKIYPSVVLAGTGGPWAFDGKSPTLQTATFVLDISDDLPTSDISQKYYLITKDIVSGNPTTLNAYSIVDLDSKKEVFSQETPVTFDNSTVQPNIVFQRSDNNTDNIPPTIKITSPENFKTIDSTVPIVVNTTDNVGVERVEYFVDSTIVNTDLSAPFFFSLDTTQFSNGQHDISTIAYDTVGNNARDNITVVVQNVSVDTIPPKVTITSLINGAIVKDFITFAANATDNVGINRVEFYVDSTLQKTLTNSPFTTQIDTTILSNGQHNFKAVAYDTADNSAGDVVTVIVQNVNVDPTPPVVNITSPTNGTTVNGIITFAATATDNVGVSRVEFFVDSILQKTIVNAPYSTQIDTTKFLNGQHSLKTVAYDAAGNSVQQSISVDVQNHGTDKPTVAITSPTNRIYVGGTIFVNVNATANTGIARVELLLDEQPWGMDTASPYVFIINTAHLSQGQHSLTAIAYDLTGNSNRHSIIFNVYN